MHTLVYTPSDREFARQIETAVRRAGHPLTDLTAKPDSHGTGAKSALIAVMSPAALNDPTIERALNTAMDAGQHIILVLAQPVGDLPKSINHLNALDFSGGIDADALEARIAAVESGAAGLPLRTRTPSVRKSNGRTGLILALLAIGMFAAGIYGVAVLGIQAPQEEYDAVNTEAALTIQAYTVPELEQYARMLPQSTDDALNYESTVRAIPTVYRAYMAGTATAVWQGTPLIVPTLIPLEPTAQPTAESTTESGA